MDTETGKMNILFVLTYYHPYISGLSVHVKRLGEEFVKKGYKVTVLCMKHDKNLPGIEMQNGIKIIRARSIAKINKALMSLEWIWLLIKNLKGISFLMINLPQAEGWLAAGLGRLMGKKVISTYHCSVKAENSFVQQIIKVVNALAMFWSDRVVVFTKDYADSVTELRLFRNKLKYILPPIPNYSIDLKWKEQLKRRLGDCVIIGMVGRIAKEKGMEYVIEAIPKLKRALSRKIKVVMVGPTDPVGEINYKRKIMKIIEIYKEDVILLGKIPEDKMGAFYSSLDLLILPSLNSTEAFGLVQVEAMKFGVPVIASDLPGVRVPIQLTGMGKLIPVGNTKAILEAIVDVYNRRDSYIRKKLLVKALFSFEKSVGEWEDLFHGKIGVI